ncbi:sugar phosphate isomerase/epimerase [Candidatus Woesearchaeota archaeon]|nr:sugar phosphate isomerase/epimerase [Candidatus Woesearchaeota archaeon]
MVDFGTGMYGQDETGSATYSNAMDRSYNPTAPLGAEEGPMPYISPEAEKVNPDEKLSVREIGMSVPFGVAAGNVEGVQAKIRAGVSSMELGFTGAGMGQRNAQTPEMYGRDTRTALREIAKVNEVKFTTHSAYNVMGMLGSDQQGNVSLTRARQGLAEVERAIEFARDTAGGGSVVVHTGEFERPLTHIYPDGMVMDNNGDLQRNYSKDPRTGRLLFRKRLSEGSDANWVLVDDRTGQGFQTVQMDRLVTQPVWLTAKEDGDYVAGKNDPSGMQEGTKVHVRKGDYVDYEGRLIGDPFGIKYEKGLTNEFKGGRVPEIDHATGRFVTRRMNVDDFETEAKEYNKSYSKLTGSNPNYWDRATGREMYMKSTLWTRAGYSLGWALQFSEEVPKRIETIEKLQKLRAFYEKLDQSLPPEEKWKILKQDTELSRSTEGLLPPETKDPLKFIDEQIEFTRKRLEYAQQSGSTQELEARDTMESMAHLKTPEKYFERHGARYYALAGLKAMRESKDPGNPIVVTMENIFPERYGGHPQELKHIVKLAREKMVNYLTKKTVEDGSFEGQLFKKSGDENLKYGPYLEAPNPYFNKGLDKKRAEELAKKHIKITIDTGHLNTWRKYWVEDPKLNPEQNDAAFNKWMLNQIEDLAKGGLIGNVHLTDNYGYHDDHLSPGQGNTPVKEIVGILRKYGYKDAFTVEPGAAATTDGSDVHGLMSTWRHFGSPIYSSSGPVRVGAPNQSWTNVQNSYFGRTYPPYFIFGAYSPSEDWTFWSGVQME